ncbi:putative epoxide hydrolase protein [Botrytis fragariae]|uniref:Putative epoxide hydrolase protein n=1 Tax=Botrytis fragariae TaxID=1964551 RepID=A0A8H6B1J7_9HELO|nr:putative epoxide hydrolase protein [Botrytis fragariae]KAF5877706.1 putative epoxide hydrolase protein [Botrytis fragariae]
MSTSPSTSLPPLPLPPGITSLYLSTPTLTHHLLVSGSPSHPLLLLLHGFPELSFSYRYLLPSLSSLGYHVVAPDQRGAGRTTGHDTRPFSTVDLHTTTISRLVTDMVFLVDALGHKDVACVIGHDFGAVVAGWCALVRPDLFKSVILLSHPFKGPPLLPTSTQTPPTSAPTEAIHTSLSQLSTPLKHYKTYYSTAHASSDLSTPLSTLPSFLRGYFYLKSGHWSGNSPHPLTSISTSELQNLPPYYIMPLHSSMRDVIQTHMQPIPPTSLSQMETWLPDSDIAVYASEYARTGFQGMLNWYRVVTSPYYSQELELFAGRTLDVPMLFVSGEKDWGMYQEPGVLEQMGKRCTRFKGIKVVPGAGHWVMQEKPEEVLEIVERFLGEVKREGMSY